MSPAPRRPQNRGLEPNLHPHPKGYRYKNPRTGKYRYFGKGVSREAANQAARTLNLIFAARTSLVDRIVGEESKSLRSVIESYISEKLPTQCVCDRTRDNRRYILRKLQAVDLASCDVVSITTRDIALYLKTLPTESMKQLYRAQLHAVMKWAINEGFIERNPVADTDAPRVERQRARLSEDGYRAIYDLADHWLRNLMDLIRLTLQRPEDLLSLRWDDCNGQRIRIEQGKTGTRLAIHIRPELAELLGRCRDEIASPYVIHRIPERIRSREQRSPHRRHHTQILRTQASRGFTAVVRRCELFAGVKNPPTLYECKSLGVAQLRQQGWPMGGVQRLAGHRSERMTEHYGRGHEAPFDLVGVEPNGPRNVTEALP